jgi:hypothetical protein
MAEPFDVVVFQKFATLGGVDATKAAGKRVIWDVCDPAWWWVPDDSRAIADRVDGVVASSVALADDFREWEGGNVLVRCIPDRPLLSHYDRQRVHQDVSPVRLIWFGLALNRASMLSGIAFMERAAANGHRIELTVCDDRPDQQFRITDKFPIYHVPWSLESEVEIISAHDIAFLPPYPGPWGRVKSNNKSLTAWACGLPVSDGQDYGLLEAMISDHVWRTRATEIGAAKMHVEGGAELSAYEWISYVSE